MKTVIQRAETRGHADHGWLQSYHTFISAGYHNPDRMNFRVMRVLNDDRVAPGIYHSEYNRNSDREAKFLQIWVIPDKKRIEPRNDQISVKDIKKEYEFFQILSPD